MRFGLCFRVTATALITAYASSLVGCTAPAAQDEARGATTSHLNACADNGTIEGIDVAKYQGDIDWQTVKGTGVAFAFARVSDGTDHPDEKFAANWTGMQAAGVVRGAYQYFRASQSVADQADLFIQAVGQLGDDDLPPVIDIETADGKSTDEVRAAMKEWIDRVQTGTGKQVLVYTAAFMNDTIGTDFSAQPLWVANFGADCPKMPDGWTQWQFFQYSESGTTDGVDGTEVDLDKFNGTLDDLKAFAKASAVASTSAASGDDDDDSSASGSGTGIGNRQKKAKGTASPAGPAVGLVGSQN